MRDTDSPVIIVTSRLHGIAEEALQDKHNITFGRIRLFNPLRLPVSSRLEFYDTIAGPSVDTNLSEQSSFASSIPNVLL